VSEDPQAYTIEKKSDGWYVTGKAIERAAAMTYWEHYGSVRRFQKLMHAIGLEADLRKAGIQEGENVHINDYVLEWQD
jgi:GTP-binding protein